MDTHDPRIAQFPHIVIVEASAGSGKTYCLAKRYTQLLIHPALKPQEVPLETILAITFTNKSAIEMKERILEFLKRIALDTFSAEREKQDILSSLAAEEEPARKKAFVIIDAVMKNYNFFQVQTIDSFINAILSGCAFKLNLSARFKTERDFGDYLIYSLDALIDRAGYDKEIKGLFEGFLRHYLYIENKTGWFPKQDILTIVTGLFSQSNKYAGSFVRFPMEAEGLLACRMSLVALIGELARSTPEGTNKIFLKSLSPFLDERKEGFDIDALSSFFEREDFPLNRCFPLPKGTQKLWDKIRGELKRLCELESASAHNYYIDIFTKVLINLKSIASKEDVLFVEALNKEAHALFDEREVGLPELYYRLATRFKHFLIDEFQDTSLLQWENLFIMIQEALASDGSLFYVGDKKQAIYRFRGGEVSLIDSVKKAFPGMPLIEESLSTNFRSQKEIVEFNNMVFSRENLVRFLSAIKEAKKISVEFNEQESEQVLEVFRGSRQDYITTKPHGYVEVLHIELPLKEEREDARKEKLFTLIDELRHRFLLKDIALLARKNEEVQILTSWILEKGIPAESEKTLNIRENAYIKELVSLLKFLQSPIDNLSFASFVLGDIFCKAAKLKPSEIQEFIFDLNRSKKEGTYLYREFRDRFPLAWESLIEEFFKNVGFIPLYELVISILSKFAIVESFPSYQGFFMRFLELIKEQEEKRQSIEAFLEFFDQARDEELYVFTRESDSIKVLTIHKAKGLEFPVVIIPFLEMNVRPATQAIAVERDELSLMRIKKKYAAFSDNLDALYRKEYGKAFVDELNSIYVAFTRAADELYIFVCSKTDKGLNMASLLLPEQVTVQGKKIDYAKRAAHEELCPKEIAPSVYRNWIPLLKDEFSALGLLKEREKVQRGEVLHAVLASIGNLYQKDKKHVVDEALALARKKFPEAKEFEALGEIVRKLVAHKKLAIYFEQEGVEVYQEKEIVDASGAAKRIDRLIISPKEALIIDYKSSKVESDEYALQVREYMAIIHDIYPGRVVRGVLMYLDDFSIEEIHAKNNNL